MGGGRRYRRASPHPGGYRAVERGEGDMPGKVPQKPNSKKVGKSLKEKRDAKKASKKSYG
jgi:hypothetical protein